VRGQVLSGSEIIIQVAHHYGVGPRLLLAAIELKSGWVTNPAPAGAALGRNGSRSELFRQQLAWAADRLNQGYYDWRGRGMELMTWEDGTFTRYAPTLNAATAGLHYFLSLYASKTQWQTWTGDGPESFIAVYRRLFGDPAQYAVEPLIPADSVPPTLSLPWSKGETWHFTGGPHGAWEEGSAWAALDFVPTGGPFGCAVPTAWATAAAPGLVIYSQDGEVMIDLDEDGHEQTGWVLFYLHMSSDGRVPFGTHMKQGDPVGHPSCEGGFSESSHLHFARRYNGEWIAADGPLSLVLSGWQAHSGGTEYDGSLTRGGETRVASESWDAAQNGVTADR
jgi:LasA protease